MTVTQEKYFSKEIQTMSTSEEDNEHECRGLAHGC